jgi:4-diphosphocytidyl-2-C-methyl-D-erythritol kinase
MPKKTVCYEAPAKINLFLHVVNRREDGYHDLETFFQLLDLSDTLEFSLRDDDRITLACPDVSGSIEHNLIFRAAQVLQTRARTKPHPLGSSKNQMPLLGVHIKVIKRIPQGGGLGGGSSNAAITLLALNELWSVNLSRLALSQIGLRLGADVPLFISGHTAWGRGTGEDLTPVDQPPFWFVLAKPPEGISTARVFQHASLKRNTPSVINNLQYELNQQSPPNFGPDTPLWQNTRNDCQAVACKLCPPLQELLNWLEARAPARLTGTGSTCFTMHKTKAEAEKLLNELQQTAGLPVAWCSLAQGIAQWTKQKKTT